MPDNLKRRRPHDAKRISANETYELGRWVVRLGLKSDELPLLRRAIGQAGDSAAAVKKWLQRNR